MKAPESRDLASQRWELLKVLQAHYPDFIPFLEDVMEDLGFSTTDIQKDIGKYIAYGPQNLMVQAQRGQAKTTIVAAFAVWSLIHQPWWRVLILSAGGAQAKDIATLIVRIIVNMPGLECMHPDKLAGDRTSVEEFDIHHSLKGVDKSPSVACVGVEANLQGKRAHLLIPDDVESTKNSATPVQRAKLAHLTKDFSSIADRPESRVLWMGTPQTMESIYVGLPARGVTIRVWPGRYPTPEQREHYGARLAPLLVSRLEQDPSLGQGGGLLGDQGQAIDPVLKDEDALQKTELNQGTAYFQLQHMLNTALMDSMRHPLKTDRIVMLQPAQQWPLSVTRGMDNSYALDKIVGDFAFKVMRPHDMSKEVSKLQTCWAYIDPAAGGANGDETAYAVGGFLNGNVIVLEVGGIPGGYNLAQLEELANRLGKYPLDGVRIEKNMGHGAFKAVFAPIMHRVRPCMIDEELVSGQKELRIINILAPIIGRGSLIMSDTCVDNDADDCARYAPATRLTYSLFFQLAHLSAMRNCLVHDDRLDALAGLANIFVEALQKDQAKDVERLRAIEHAERIADPMGHNRYGVTVGPQSRGSLLTSRPTSNLLQSRFTRRR